MLDLAISVDTDPRGTDIIETNHGEQFNAPSWPRDCEFQLVSFRPGAKTCDVVTAAELVDDIAHALQALKATGLSGTKKPEWYKRLNQIAEGAGLMGNAQCR
jgi:hypothetical protein